ncbi:hypothetical protein D9M73_125760 [compost metagenome]
MLASLPGLLGKQHRQRLDVIQAGARGFGHAHRDVEPPVALIEQTGLAAPERRGNRVGHFAHRETIACNGGAIELHVERRRTTNLVSLYAARARNGLQDANHLAGRLRHLVEVVAVELDGDVTANTRDQFVEAKLDRLAHFIDLTELTT